MFSLRRLAWWRYASFSLNFGSNRNRFSRLVGIAVSLSLTVRERLYSSFSSFFYRAVLHRARLHQSTSASRLALALSALVVHPPWIQLHRSSCVPTATATLRAILSSSFSPSFALCLVVLCILSFCCVDFVAESFLPVIRCVMGTIEQTSNRGHSNNQINQQHARAIECMQSSHAAEAEKVRRKSPRLSLQCEQTRREAERC